MRIGLLYDLFDDYPWHTGEPPDADAEYEPVETVMAIASAFRRLGHEPVWIGTARDLLSSLPTLDVDVAINIAEGAHSRNREAYVPVLLEMAGVPLIGSDALTLSLSLDKALTKDLVATVGVPTPPFRTYRTADEVNPDDLPGPFPLFVKPRYEGSSKGITPESRVDTVEALREQVTRTVALYRQDALVEVFIEGGGEFTVCVVGTHQPRALPVLQRAVERQTRIGLHALERRGMPELELDFLLEGTLSPELEHRLQALSLRVFEKLECRDFARVDFRVDGDGHPWFLEINPLPTFAPDGTFAIVAELMGMEYDAFLAGILEEALERLTAESAHSGPPKGLKQIAENGR